MSHRAYYKLPSRIIGLGNLNKALEFKYKLHRVMANYVPSNIRSENLLNRLGFRKEGTAKSYLKIAGSWQDHVLTSKINLCETDI